MKSKLLCNMKHIVTILLCFFTQLSAYSQSDWDEDDNPWNDGTEITIPIGQQITQNIKLSEGCNWISIYIKGGLAVSNITDLGVIRIESQSEECIFDTELGWVGTLKHLVPGAGYKIYATHDVTIPLTGYWCGNEPCAHVLQTGWNWIGTPYFINCALTDAITNPSAGDMIIYQNSIASYDGTKWTGTISELLPSTSYLYKSVNNKTLTFK